MLVRIAALGTLSCPELWHVIGEFLSPPPEAASSVGSPSRSHNYADQTASASYQQKGGFGKSWLRADSFSFHLSLLVLTLVNCVCRWFSLSKVGGGAPLPCVLSYGGVRMKKRHPLAQPLTYQQTLKKKRKQNGEIHPQ